MTQPTLINVHPNDNSQELHHHPSVINVDRSWEL